MIYYRLIVLWILCEALLGGVIHAFRLPVSGLIVGSCAVICICLIAWYAPKKGAILKATLIVAIFKMMLSPQAGFPAYIAVFFQGLLGEILFFNRRLYSLSCILLGILALLESGLQRIIVLTIVYGNDLWNVINDFFNGLTKQKQNTNYSLLIGGGYVALHLFAGLLAGWWAAMLPGKISRWSKNEKYKINITAGAEIPIPGKRKRKWKSILFFLWIALLLIYFQSVLGIGKSLLPKDIILRLLIRSVIIILGWIFIIGPLVKFLLHRWLEKKQTKWKEDIREVIYLLPFIRNLVTESWNRSNEKKGIRRLFHFSRILLVNSVVSSAGTRMEIYILSAPIQSGKTSFLLNWSEGRKDIFGIITPIVNGKRVFMDAHTKEQFKMEADENETSVLKVGRFAFSKKSFDRAITIIRDAKKKDGWLIIDEIGPLELKGEGFSEILKEVILNRDQKTLIVVRSGIRDEIINHFSIKARNWGESFY